MTSATQELTIEHDAPIHTWFKVGGGAHRLAHPLDAEQLRHCIDIDPHLRMLGSGANLLVHDAGVQELVVSLDAPRFKRVEVDPSNEFVHAGAGADLARLILDCQRAGLAGLENLAGVPATVGGAIRMNAGGRFGEIADYVRYVHAIDREGAFLHLPRESIGFGYRTSGLDGVVITGVDLSLQREDPEPIRDRLLEIMREKKHSQPMGANCAGCCFKNPLLDEDVTGIGSAGQRVGAGLVIDRAGCKSMGVGGAKVSEVHANFVTSRSSATASDVIELLDRVRERVFDAFGIRLQREIDVWGQR